MTSGSLGSDVIFTIHSWSSGLRPQDDDLSSGLMSGAAMQMPLRTRSAVERWSHEAVHSGYSRRLKACKGERWMKKVLNFSSGGTDLERWKNDSCTQILINELLNARRWSQFHWTGCRKDMKLILYRGDLPNAMLCEPADRSSSDESMILAKIRIWMLRLKLSLAPSSSLWESMNWTCASKRRKERENTVSF